MEKDLLKVLETLCCVAGLTPQLTSSTTVRLCEADALRLFKNYLSHSAPYRHTRISDFNKGPCQVRLTARLNNGWGPGTTQLYLRSRAALKYSHALRPNETNQHHRFSCRVFSRVIDYVMPSLTCKHLSVVAVSFAEVSNESLKRLKRDLSNSLPMNKVNARITFPSTYMGKTMHHQTFRIGTPIT